MKPNVVTTDDVGFRTLGYVYGRMLKRGTYDFTIAKVSQSIEIPKNKTKTVQFRRYESLPAVVAPLAEAVPPPAGQLTYTDIETTLEQYGYFVPLSDQIIDMHEDKMFKVASDLCGEQINESCERIDIATAKGGTTVFYANGVGSRALVNSPPLRGDLRKIYRYLKKYKAKEVTTIVKPGPNIATEPVDPGFIVFGSTDLDADIRNLEGFIPVKNYADPGKAWPHEIGSVDQFRFVLTQLFESWEQSGAVSTDYLSAGEAVTVPTAADVYPLLIFSQDAFGTTKLQGEGAITPGIYTPKNVPGDELAQKGFVSWKMYRANIILNQVWLVRYEVNATSNPTW